jgi:hypothetical protein
VVCPAGYNIPKMNRLLASGMVREALELSISELTTVEIKCKTCAGYCENACRRKKIDIPVSIRNIQLFVSKNVSGVDNDVKSEGNMEVSNPIRITFSSRIGKMYDSELTEWLKESVPDAERFRDIKDFGSAGSEAQSCMHCDCRAADDCLLREVAQKLSLKDPVGKIVNATIQKKINQETGLIFENDKVRSVRQGV